MYYIIPAANPAGAVPLAQPQYEEPQYQYGLEGNQVLYIAAGQDQVSRDFPFPEMCLQPLRVGVRGGLSKGFTLHLCPL